MKNYVRCVEIRAFCNGIDHLIANVNVESVYDNLIDKVIFKYTLADINKQYAGEGYVELNGITEYNSWDSTASGAYGIVFAELNLTKFLVSP